MDSFKPEDAKMAIEAFKAIASVDPIVGKTIGWIAVTFVIPLMANTVLTWISNHRVKKNTEATVKNNLKIEEKSVAEEVRHIEVKKSITAVDSSVRAFDSSLKEMESRMMVEIDKIKRVEVKLNKKIEDHLGGIPKIEIAVAKFQKDLDEEKERNKQIIEIITTKKPPEKK